MTLILLTIHEEDLGRKAFDQIVTRELKAQKGSRTNQAGPSGANPSWNVTRSSEIAYAKKQNKKPMKNLAIQCLVL